MPSLHDWTLESIEVNWPKRTVRIIVSGLNGKGEILAERFSGLTVPRLQEWGPSTSINTTHGPDKQGEQGCVFNIQMQTGDVIVVIADTISFT